MPCLVRTYFADQPNPITPLRRLVLEGAQPVVTSELARVEFAGAVAGAHRAGRLHGNQTVLDRFDADCGDKGTLTLLRLSPERVLPLAYQLVR